MTATDFVKGALRRINAYQSGETIAPQDLNDALEVANDLLDSWSTDKNYVFGTNEYILAWVPGQTQYRVGNPTNASLGLPGFTGTLTAGSSTISGITNLPAGLVVGSALTDSANVIPAGTLAGSVGGTSVSMVNAAGAAVNATATPGAPDTIGYTLPGDFAIPRPLRITGGYTRINELDFTLDVYATQDEYNSVLYKAQPGPWPVIAWYNNLMPYGILNVYQSPGQAGQLHLFTDTILANLSASTPIIMPQGYARAFKWCLAKELWSEYWGNQPLPASISKQADESLKMILALNAQPAKRSSYDRALTRGNRPDGGWITHGGFGNQ